MKTENEPVHEYKVYPQDPLITPDPENYKLKGEVVPGPESNRVKTIDSSEPCKPDEKGNFAEDVASPKFDRVNSFLFAAKTLKMYEDALGRKISYAFPDEQLKIQPRAGVDMNAYYSRWDQEIQLFYFNNDHKPGEVCYTAKMADVVSHEAGHAVLDGLRPGYIGWGSAGGAVHEGFGDSTTMLIALSNENLIDKVIQGTGGDLRKENLIASLGEQFGMAYYGDKLYLRNAINDLKESDFSSGRESKEVHNYGRLFGAFFYDILTEMAAEHAKTMPLKNALIKTKDDLTKLFARTMGDFSPAGNVYFEDIAKAFLKADKNDFNGKYKNVLTKVFKNRELLDDKKIEDWETGESKLPDLTLPPNTLDSKESIVQFVNTNKDKLGLAPESNYQLESAYNNTNGETFIHLKSPKTVPFPFEGENFSITVNEGLTLGFNKAGKLFHIAKSETTAYDIADAMDDAKAQLKKMKKLQDMGIKIKKPTVYKRPGLDGTTELIKAPIIEDPPAKKVKV